MVCVTSEGTRNKEVGTKPGGSNDELRITERIVMSPLMTCCQIQQRIFDRVGNDSVKIMKKEEFFETSDPVSCVIVTDNLMII